MKDKMSLKILSKKLIGKNLKEQEVKEYLLGKKAIIVSPKRQDRSTWKTLVAEAGIEIEDIHLFTSALDALDVMENNKIEVLLTSYQLNEGECLDLVKKHIERVPDRTDANCIVISDKNSLSISASVAEEEADSYIIKPSSVKKLKELLTKAFYKKCNPSDYDKTIGKACELIGFGQFEKAYMILDEAKGFTPDHALTFCFQGHIKELNRDEEQALIHYKAALNIDPYHHRSLRKSFDLEMKRKNFGQAYEYCKVLFENYPINPRRIPSFIKLSIATNNYDNIIQFCDVVLSIENMMGAAKIPVAAGLAIAGKHLGQSGNNQSAFMALKRALKIAEEKDEIVDNVLESLINIGQAKLVLQYLQKIPVIDRSERMEIIELKSLASTGQNQKAFDYGVKLLSKNVKTQDVFEIMIQSAQKINLEKESLDDLIEQALNTFPLLSEYFLNL